ncbi:MAG: acetolactate decarboxylase [Euryarchaeota archaeon]|nr:acetolactate decarboxylase [Euryarchaeota archaeon]
MTPGRVDMSRMITYIHGDQDRTAGGHVLEFTVKDAGLSPDYTSELYTLFPNTEEFNNLDLAKSRKEELEKAET